MPCRSNIALQATGDSAVFFPTRGSHSCHPPLTPRVRAHVSCRSSIVEFGVCLTNYVNVTSKEANVGTARLSGQVVGLLGWPQSVRGQSASLIPPFLAAYVNVRTASSDTFCDAGELPSPRRCHCLARSVMEARSPPIRPYLSRDARITRIASFSASFVTFLVPLPPGKITSTPPG